MLWAVLGILQFTLPTYLDAMPLDETFNYAEHDLINGKPRLQWIGDGLDQLQLEMSFHLMFCDPETEMDNLRAAAEAHQAMPLVLGNGTHMGSFVITAIHSEMKQTDDQANVIAMTATVTLKEFVGDPTQTQTPPGNNAGRTSGAIPLARQDKPPVPGPSTNPDDVTVQQIVRQ